VHLVRRKVVYVVVAIAILAVGALYVSGYQVYRYKYTAISGDFPRGPSQGWSAVYFVSSGKMIGEFNYSAANSLTANNTRPGVSFGFVLWHAPGYSIERVNLTFSIAPWPKDVWVNAFNYDTDGYAPLHFENINFSGDTTEASGAVLTLSNFPSENPTTTYGVGLTYKNASVPADVGGTTLLVQMVLVSGSGIPFVGNEYTGQTGFNLVYAA
jgi:hypothetical protein